MDLKTLGLGLLVLNGLIILHEWGHFFAARRMGLPVPEFSVGFGPRLLGWTRGETAYSLRLFPIGGYVLLPDLAPEPGGEAISIRRRLLTVIAGPAANLALVVLLLGPATALRACLLWTGLMAGLVADLFGGGSGPAPELLGPIGVSEAVGQAAALGWRHLLQLTALLSLNLGLFNLLPFPGLDGGRILSLLIERLTGGRRPSWEPVVQGLGLLLFLGLGLWVTGRELLALIMGWL
ncbi:MAG: site-2 protease family protein [Bacillota bacterium]